MLWAYIGEEGVTELSLYDAESGEETSLAVFDGELVRSLCMDGEGTMYYTTTGSLNRWDKSSNTRTRLLELHANGLSSSTVSNNLLTNSQRELLEEIKELLVYLLSYEIQFEDSYESVRKDVIRDCVGYDESTEKYYLKVSALDYSWMELSVKPDGTTWLEEYLAFIETCELEPSWRYTPIGEILSEEVQSYFAGDKSAEDVAKVIQSRVQMYLEEHK